MNLQCNFTLELPCSKSPQKSCLTSRASVPSPIKCNKRFCGNRHGRQRVIQTERPRARVGGAWDKEGAEWGHIQSEAGASGAAGPTRSVEPGPPLNAPPNSVLSPAPLHPCHESLLSSQKSVCAPGWRGADKADSYWGEIKTIVKQETMRASNSPERSLSLLEGQWSSERARTGTSPASGDTVP